MAGGRGAFLLWQVRAARRAGLPILVAHENDEEKDACKFSESVYIPSVYIPPPSFPPEPHWIPA